VDSRIHLGHEPQNCTGESLKQPHPGKQPRNGLGEDAKRDGCGET